jgi:NDP-sugar pyrophosphorylase family protein
LAKKTVKIDLGVIETSGDDELINYVEKPRYDYRVSMGIYVFEPEVLPYINGEGRIDLPDLILRLVREGKKPMAFASDCQWLDIGRFDDYGSALEVFETQRELFLPAASGIMPVDAASGAR